MTARLCSLVLTKPSLCLLSSQMPGKYIDRSCRSLHSYWSQWWRSWSLSWFQWMLWPWSAYPVGNREVPALLICSALGFPGAHFLFWFFFSFHGKLSSSQLPLGLLDVDAQLGQPVVCVCCQHVLQVSGFGVVSHCLLFSLCVRLSLKWR